MRRKEESSATWPSVDEKHEATCTQEAQKPPNERNAKRPAPRHAIIRPPKAKGQERSENGRERGLCKGLGYEPMNVSRSQTPTWAVGAQGENSQRAGTALGRGQAEVVGVSSVRGMFHFLAGVVVTQVLALKSLELD